MLAIAGQDDSTLVGEALTNALVAHGQGGCADCIGRGGWEGGREREVRERSVWVILLTALGKEVDNGVYLTAPIDVGEFGGTVE